MSAITFPLSIFYYKKVNRTRQHVLNLVRAENVLDRDDNSLAKESDTVISDLYVLRPTLRPFLHRDGQR